MSAQPPAAAGEPAGEPAVVAQPPEPAQPASTGKAAGAEPVSAEPPPYEHLLQVTDLVKEFPVRGGGLFRKVIGKVQAVSRISLHLDAGETLGVVGESGCGKSTAGRAILQLHKPTSGSVLLRGRELTTMSTQELRVERRNLQIVFQDPYASLNPKMPVNNIIGEALRIHGMGQKEGLQRVGDLLKLVGLSPEHGNRYPHEFSGGQRQRIGIARALALEPEVLILDEPVSALDVSVQAGVVNLLEDLQDVLGLAYFFIAHDLSIVRHISDRIAVMYLGKIVETGDRDTVYNSPTHPYTVALLSAAPEADPELERTRQRIILTGDVPSPLNPPSGCRFRTRCWKAQQICADEEPLPLDHGNGSLVACHFPVTDVAAETFDAAAHAANAAAAREADAATSPAA